MGTTGTANEGPEQARADKAQRDQRLHECLVGAGCSHATCEGAQTLSCAGHAEELLPQLAEHRLRLLAELRETDERLACLDRAIATIRAKGEPWQ